MQNTWRRGFALGNAPDARFLRWRYQHVGIFWCYLTLRFAFSPTPNLKFAFSPTPTPDASQWNIGCVGSQRKILALAMYISCFLCRFHLRLVPNANPISSGIWTSILFCNYNNHKKNALKTCITYWAPTLAQELSPTHTLLSLMPLHPNWVYCLIKFHKQNYCILKENNCFPISSQGAPNINTSNSQGNSTASIRTLTLQLNR